MLHFYPVTRKLKDIGLLHGRIQYTRRFGGFAGYGLIRRFSRKASDGAERRYFSL
jgi:hypothetical protein